MKSALTMIYTQYNAYFGTRYTLEKQEILRRWSANHTFLNNVRNKHKQGLTKVTLPFIHHKDEQNNNLTKVLSDSHNLRTHNTYKLDFYKSK